MGHLQENGFEVVTADVSATELSRIKKQHGVSEELSGCHTGVVDGYVIEGHVPADLVTRLLAERPEVSGLAVPGMPRGSPGMEGMGKDPYDVLTFDAEGNVTVYDRR